MRTFVTLTPDVAMAVRKLQQEEGLELSEALNALVGRALPASLAKTDKPFKQRTKNLGAKIDITNIGEVFEALER